MSKIQFVNCMLLASIFLKPCPILGHFRPTRNFGKDPDMFWFQDYTGKVIPVFLKTTNSTRITGRQSGSSIKFFLYNNKRLSEGSTKISVNCKSCFNSFVERAPVVFLAHGFSSSHKGTFGTTLRNGFSRAATKINLIFINWEDLAAAPFYGDAANNVEIVGKKTARLIEFLVETNLASISDITFVGHSLGAHVGNYVASNLKNLVLPRIFALDPANPLFREREEEDRIDPSDASHVQVIHTETEGVFFVPRLGLIEACGHVDFYPNYGSSQPGCGFFDVLICSHSRSIEYFSESVHRSQAFVGCECPSVNDALRGTCDCGSNVIMGWHTPETERGIYYLATKGSSPYGIGFS